MRNNKKTSIGIFALLFLALLIYNVSAFAVSSAYYAGNPLKMSPGETKNIQLILQNSVGGENVTVKASIASGSEIIRLIDPSDIYEVDLGSKKEVNLQVNIPDDAEIGNVYNVEVSFLSSGGKGTLSFGSGVGQKFDVVVSPKQVDQNNVTSSQT